MFELAEVHVARALRVGQQSPPEIDRSVLSRLDVQVDLHRGAGHPDRLDAHPFEVDAVGQHASPSCGLPQPLFRPVAMPGLGEIGGKDGLDIGDGQLRHRLDSEREQGLEFAHVERGLRDAQGEVVVVDLRTAHLPPGAPLALLDADRPDHGWRVVDAGALGGILGDVDAEPVFVVVALQRGAQLVAGRLGVGADELGAEVHPGRRRVAALGPVVSDDGGERL